TRPCALRSGSVKLSSTVVTAIMGPSPFGESSAVNAPPAGFDSVNTEPGPTPAAPSAGATGTGGAVTSKSTVAPAATPVRQWRLEAPVATVAAPATVQVAPVKRGVKTATVGASEAKLVRPSVANWSMWVMATP